MIIFIFSSTIFSQIGYGDNLIIGTGFSRILQSPCYYDFSINPASFYDNIYSSFTPEIIITSSGQFEWLPSLFILSLNIMRFINVGLFSNVLYTKNFSYEFPEDSNEWDHFIQRVMSKGSIFSFSGFFSTRINKLSLGFGFGKISGVSMKIQIFDFRFYKDIYDTFSLLNHTGNSYYAGLMYGAKPFSFGLSINKYSIGNEDFFYIYYGTKFDFKDITTYLSMKGLNPSFGILYKNLVFGGSYLNKDNKKEKIIGFGFSSQIKRNTISIINNFRFVDGELLGIKKSDFSYHLSISFEFLE